MKFEQKFRPTQGQLILFICVFKIILNEMETNRERMLFILNL